MISKLIRLVFLPLAISRCQKAYQIFYNYCHHHSCKIICTGGYGEHFNITSSPHAHYLKKYLMSLGIDEACFLPIVESRFTLEDATLAKEIFNDYPNDKITVVTSDFHINRVEYIFTTLYPDRSFTFASCFSDISLAHRHKLETHERQALEREKTTLEQSVKFI